MRLSEIIRESTGAIQRKGTAQARVQSSEAYAKALRQLAQVNSRLKRILDCVTAIREKGICTEPLLQEETRDELWESANWCAGSLKESGLTLDMVRLLQTRVDMLEEQLRPAWQAAAQGYAHGAKGYLALIEGFTQDPQQARSLVVRITQAVEQPPSLERVEELVSDVAQAEELTRAFALNPEIEKFLKRVSACQATVADLTPEVMKWLEEKGLSGKLQVRFG